MDIRVALASGARLGAHAPAPGTQAAAGITQDNAPQGAAGLLKAWARRCARALFRLGKPVVRPVAFRFRAYLAAPLQAEMQQLRQNLAQERSANRRWRDSTERSLATHTQLLQELRSLRATPTAAPAAGVLRTREPARNGVALLLSRLLESEAMAIIKLDPRRDSEAALRRAVSLMEEAESGSATALVIAWPGSRDRQALPNGPAWLRFFAQPGLAVGAIDSETGMLRPVRFDQTGEHTIDLLLTRADSKAWTTAGRSV